MNTRRHITTTFATAAAAAAMLVTASCGSAAEEAGDTAAEQLTERLAESQGGGDVDVDFDSGDGSFSLETEDGSFETGSGAVPEEWPEDVPLPDGLEVVSGSTSDTDAGVTVAIVGTSTTSPSDLLAELKSALADWEISGETTGTTGDDTLAGAQFDTEGRRVNFTATSSGSETSITLSHNLLE